LPLTIEDAVSFVPFTVLLPLTVSSETRCEIPLPLNVEGIPVPFTQYYASFTVLVPLTVLRSTYSRGYPSATLNRGSQYC